MAKIIKFALELKDGESARTIEDLREHFDLEKMVAYFMNGRLLTWLKHRHLDEEAAALESLSAEDTEFAKKLCDILGVTYDELQEKADSIDTTALMEDHERLNRLRQVTTDPEILAKIDRVAFDEKDFRRLAYGTGHEVYLCNGRFVIPLNVQNKHYIGLGKVEAVIDSEVRLDFEQKGIQFTNVRFDEEYQKIADRETPNELFEKGKAAQEAGKYDEALQWYRKASDEGNGEAMNTIGTMYAMGEGVNRDFEIAAQWYQKAVDVNCVRSMGNLGQLYVMGKGVPKDIEKGLRLLKKGSEEDSLFSYFVGATYYEQGNFTEALLWLKRAAEAEDIKEAVKMDAMYHLGTMYDFGDGVAQNDSEAYKWYLKAAEGGNSAAMYCLGSMYNSGSGIVSRNYRQAQYWMTKAADAGDETAQRWVEEDRKWVYEVDSDFKGYEGY